MSLDQHFAGLVGDWSLVGEILGKRLVQDVEVRSVLEGAYLRIHYLPSTVTPITDRPYEAFSFIGWVPDDGPIMYLFDTFGARFSAPGIGRLVESRRFRFRFDYPDGEFLTDLIETDDGWRIEQFSVVDGSEKPFGVKRLSRSTTRR